MRSWTMWEKKHGIALPRPYECGLALLLPCGVSGRREERDTSTPDRHTYTCAEPCRMQHGQATPEDSNCSFWTPGESIPYWSEIFACWAMLKAGKRCRPWCEQMSADGANHISGNPASHAIAHVGVSLVVSSRWNGRIQLPAEESTVWNPSPALVPKRLKTLEPRGVSFAKSREMVKEIQGSCRGRVTMGRSSNTTPMPCCP